MKYKTFYTSLSHNSPSPPPFSLSLSLSPLSLSCITTHLPSHSQVLSSHKRKPPSHSSLSNSSAPLISHTTHCWLNLNHCQLQPPIINLIVFFFFFSIQSFNSLSLITGSTSTSTVLNSPTDSQISIFLPLCGFINLGFWLVCGLWWVASCQVLRLQWVVEIWGGFLMALHGRFS